jgi:hypothetical protein
MNRRKAGEDFYFLHKIFPLGNIDNIQTATVIPSPRPSDRVPFGTGRAINDIISQPAKEYKTYNPKIFIDLKKLIDRVAQLYNHKDPSQVITSFPESIQHFLDEISLATELEKIKKNSTSEAVFLKSFYQWFNGFIVLKYVHFARDHYYGSINVAEAARWILDEMKQEVDQEGGKKYLLNMLRAIDRSV